MSGLQGLQTELDQADIDRIALEMEMAYDSGNDYVDAGDGGATLDIQNYDNDDDDIWMDVEAGEYEGDEYDDEDEEIELSSFLHPAAQAQGAQDEDEEDDVPAAIAEEEEEEEQQGQTTSLSGAAMAMLMQRLGGTVDLRQLLRSGIVRLVDGNNNVINPGGSGLTGRQRRRAAGDDEEDDSEESDEDTFAWWMTHRGRFDRKMSRKWETIQEGVQTGRELRFSGDFGRTTPRFARSQLSRWKKEGYEMAVDIGEPAFEEPRSIASRIASWRSGSSAFNAGVASSSAFSGHNISRQDLAPYMVPNSEGVEVARYPLAPCYVASYAKDGSFFYTCAKDFTIQLYDTTRAPSKTVQKIYPPGVHPGQRYSSRRRRAQAANNDDDEEEEEDPGAVYTTLSRLKTVHGKHGGWTVTDADLSPDSRWMIYSTASSSVTLIPTSEYLAAAEEADQAAAEEAERRADENQVILEFGQSHNQAARFGGRFGYEGIPIWSLRFSGDSKEIVAGAKNGVVCVYDIEARRRLQGISAHSEDVNAVTFADDHSQNILVSGSDDSFIKVWDRRSLSGGKAAGWLPGHTEGITYVCPKGDGKYLLSNGKDQTCKLWDLRMMMSGNEVETSWFGHSSWDYRSTRFPRPQYPNHPQDRSVMSYRGHAVLYTLIRCRFSPASSTGQQYVYSGSADGNIHIWSLDGQVVQVLDRAKAKSLKPSSKVPALDPSSPISPSERQQLDSAARTNYTVRDVSWSPNEPALMSTGWEGGRGEFGSVVKHEWKGFGKNGLTSLSDWTERRRAEMCV